MRGGDEFTALPSAVQSMTQLVDLANGIVEPLEPRETDSRRNGDSRQHSHHVSKSEHFRRLEERMDQLHEEMRATQRMVHALTEALHHKAEGSDSHESRSAVVRQTFRTLSGKALRNARGPVGMGPSSALPIAATFLSSLSPSQSKAKSGFQHMMATSDPDGDGKAAELREQSHVGEISSDGITHKAALVDRNASGSHTRKLSATNPIALLPPQSGGPKFMVSMAVAHAATFISEIAHAASVKRLQSKAPTESPPTGFGPVTSRRFSISSLEGNGEEQARGNRVSRAFQWSRNLFRPRLESVVTPEEIRDARSDYATLHRFTIRHDSVQRMVWDTIVIIMIIVDIVVTPLSLGFRYFPRGINAYNTFGNVIFATDFLINMLSSYTTPRGVLISGPRNTLRHYLLGPWALPDFLSWFPFEILVESQQGRFLGIAKVIRLAKMSQLARRLHSARKAGLFRFIKLLGIVFIVSHCLSCYWNWVAVDWRNTEDGYLDMTLGQKYAHCWSLVIGSLNASPPSMHSTTEEVSVAFFMLIGNVLQATVFGSVAVLIQSFDEEEVAYNKKLINTYERCRFLGIPEKLARRIQGYYENLYQETHSVDPDADAFINELSPALICEVKFQLYRDMIKQIPFLSATHINPVVIEMLILHLRTVIYMQDDVLIRKGEVGDWMGFIGSKGSVGVLDPKSETRKIIRILRKGDYFGEMALLQRAKRSTTAIALSWVQIHVLCRNDLDDVKAQYPEQAEILEQEINKYMQSKVTYK